MTPVLLPLFMGACGPASSTQDSQPAIQKDIITENQIKAAQNGKLTCDFVNECEPSVAMVSVATSEGVSRCTGFLIGNNQVMTNDHCLESLPQDEKSCQGLVFVHFNHEVHRACRKVTIRSQQTGVDSKDYAVIELDKPVTDRKPVKLSKRGFTNHENAEIYRIQMSSDESTLSYDGVQTKLTCQASYATLMGANLKSAREPLMTFGDCAIQLGNSGSPVFNIYGEVGAIIQGYLTLKDSIIGGQSVEQQIKDYLLDESYGEIAIGTQTHCMPELMNGSEQTCLPLKKREAYLPKDYLSFYTTLPEGALPRLNPEQVWRAQGSLTTTIPQVKKVFFTTPPCVWLEDIQYFNFMADVMSYRLGLTSYLQAEWRADFKMGEKKVRFDPQATPAGRVRTIDFKNAEYGMISVPVCQY